MKHLGWILDLYPKNGEMIVWLKKPDGGSVRLVDHWTPRIHVAGELRDLLDLACKLDTQKCRLVERFEKPGDREKTRVLQVEVDGDREAAAIASRVQRIGCYSKFRLYDVDIPSAQMYLYRKDLFPLALVTAEETQDGILWTLEDSRESIEYRLPPLRTARLQVKTRRKGPVQGLEDELDEASLVLEAGERFSTDSGDETEKILRLVRTFHETDPDIILTRGGDSFIFPFLARRAQKNGILDELVLGREESSLRVYEVQGHSYFSYGKILYRETAARLLGRLHIDETNAYISSDCGLEGLFEVSRTCIIPTQKASRATIGTSMTSLQLYSAVKQGVLIPWSKNITEEVKDSNELVTADRGGFIYEPAMGIHDEIGELDFSSLYPTLMLRGKLSGETVKCQCCPDSTDRVPELGYNICQRWQGIVPRSLEILLRRRALFKSLKKTAADPQTREVFDRRQAALKWILVCSFGYLGFKNARFGKIDAHIATCAFARKALRMAVEIATSRGFRLVHAIVDSMWLEKRGVTADGYTELCEEISERLDLPISFEGCYKWIVFLDSKVNPRIPVLNRYYGVFQDGTIKVRGIELRRHDTPEIVNKCQSEMLALLSKAKDSSEFRAFIPEALGVMRTFVASLRNGTAPLEDLVIEKNLSKDPYEYTNLVPQAVAAQHMLRAGGSVHAGQRVNYILTRDGRGTAENRALPWELADSRTEYDAEKYVDLLVSSVKNILLPFGYDKQALEAIISGSLHLVGSN